MKPLPAGLVVPLLLVSLLSACSGDETPRAEDTTSTSPGTTGPADEPGEGPAGADPDAPGAGTAYCKLIETDLASLFASVQGPADVEAMVDKFQQIADEAPAEIEADWAVMESALAASKAALTKYAVLQQKFAAGKVSKDRMKRQTAKVMADLQALDTPENNAAGSAVSAHAAEYCGTNPG